MVPHAHTTLGHSDHREHVDAVPSSISILARSLLSTFSHADNEDNLGDGGDFGLSSNLFLFDGGAFGGGGGGPCMPLLSQAIPDPDELLVGGKAFATTTMPTGIGSLVTRPTGMGPFGLLFTPDIAVVGCGATETTQLTTSVVPNC